MKITDKQFFEVYDKLCDLTDYTKNGVCSGCGRCCSNNIPLTKKEIKELKQIVKKRKLKPTWNIALTNMRNYSNCPFLTNDNKCLIYQDRPQICKSFKCDMQKKKVFDKELLKEPMELINLREEIFERK